MSRTRFFFLLVLASSLVVSLCAQDASPAAAQADQQLPPRWVHFCCHCRLDACLAWAK